MASKDYGDIRNHRRIDLAWDEFLNAFELAAGEKWTIAWSNLFEVCIVSSALKLQKWTGERVSVTHLPWKKVDAQRVALQFVSDDKELKMFKKLLVMCPEEA